MAGGGVAGTIQAGTSLIRLGSTKFTGGIGNSIFSTFENVLSVGISLVSIWIPLIMGVLAILLVFWMLKKLFKSKK
jgi:asparagine N-glycosylation enzyme membrane subunit Stt3